ncbi:hypothetical protein RclHR1_13810002 [Rhizophagus clarus]|uniref:Uncharacterized protein n=1 Tax=Rhizophagus clarus TaxID=94130 RepID=A0A2Z6QNI8_9GLOM|nr:hypothetical protein RclHR1_13810002 [Rhizophagus clarus]
MPGQLSTILYISEYTESVSSNFIVGSAVGMTQLEGDEVQMFNITVFYPTDSSVQVYVPKLEPKQILSVNNCKFSKGSDNKIDLIVTSAKVLNMQPSDLPVYPIFIVAVGMATDVPTISKHGVKIDCIVNEYLSKDKNVDIPITIFHPNGSRLKSQTTNVRRGSVLFFSGEMTTVDGQLYLELHNFSFLKGQNNQVSPKVNFMPWLETGSVQVTPTRSSNAQLIHNQQKSPESDTKQKPFQPNKSMKLADIATSILAKNDENEKEISEMDADKEEIDEQSDVEEINKPAEINTNTKKRRSEKQTIQTTRFKRKASKKI